MNVVPTLDYARVQNVLGVGCPSPSVPGGSGREGVKSLYLTVKYSVKSTL